MLASRTARRLGWISAILGGLMIATIVLVGVLFAVSEGRWEGNARLTTFLIAVTALITVFGLVVIAAGVWQIRHGTRNKTLVYVILGLGVAFVIMVVPFALTT
jgi:hypothetical protein